MRKLKVLIVIVVISLSVLLLHKKNDIILLGDENHIIGDVDSSGRVGINDYLLIKRHLLKISILTGNELNYADVDGNGSIGIGDYLAVKKIILYGPTTRTVTATFKVQDEKNISSSYISQSCTINIGEGECEIIAPVLTAKTGYTVIGWSESKNATESTINQDTTIKISNDINYYSISRNDTPLKAVFTIMIKADKEGENQTCYRYNGSDNCFVQAPVIVPDTGYQAEGWADIDSEKTVAKSGGTFAIKEDGIYYSVVKRDIIVSFDENENISNSDLSKTNIKADRLSFYSTSCTSYNDNGCKITRIPIIYSKGNRIAGYSLTKDGGIIEIQKKVFKENTMLYARVNNRFYGNNKWYKSNTYQILESKEFGNIVVEFDDKITDKDYIDYIYFYLGLLYKEHPELFYFNGKIIILSDETYKSSYINTSYQSSNGITHWYRGFSVIIIHGGSTKRRTCFTITHELGHAYDNSFSQINNGLIRDRDTIKNSFNKYLNEENKPFRPYSFNLSTNSRNTDKGEFVADLIAYGTVKDFSIKRIVEYHDDGLAYSYLYRPDATYDQNNYITTELYNLYVALTNEGKSYYKEVGIIN